MATMQICYKDSTGRVVCRDTNVPSMMMAGDTTQTGSARPNRGQNKRAIDSLVDDLLAEEPEYFALVYAPDGMDSATAE